MTLFADLRDVTVTRSDDPMTQAVTFRVRQNLPSGVLVAHATFPANALRDTALPLAEMLKRSVDRTFRPWRYPDSDVMPTFDLFPRATRSIRAVKGPLDRMWNLIAHDWRRSPIATMRAHP